MIPPIGTFLAGATVIGLALPAPVERLLGGRLAAVALALLALAGMGPAWTAFVFPAGGQTPLFGFREPGHDPAAILASHIAEGAAVPLLVGFLLARCVA